LKAGKIILVVVALIVIGVGVTSVFLMNNMDRLARETFEEGGLKLLGSPVTLDEVKITLIQGKARFSGLSIANPAGYSDKPAIRIGSIEVDIDLSSINEPVLVIENILIRDPDVNYEMNKEGKANIDMLQKRIDDATPSQGSNSGLMIIDRLDVKGGTIIATAEHKPDQKLEFDFPVLFMSDLGEPHGLSPEEIGAEISEALMERIVTAATSAGVNALVDEQKDKLEEKAKEKIEDKLKDLLKRD
jgi:uncharacterized protein involved in outer membrane biogenesis